MAKYPDANSDDEVVVDVRPNAPPAAAQRASSSNIGNGRNYTICFHDGRSAKVTAFFRLIDEDRLRAALRKGRGSM